LSHEALLRLIRTLVDEVLGELSPRFETLYAGVGRPSIPPEKLLRAQLLQVLYTVRSERQLMEQLDYNLLFRRFVGLNMDDPVWDPTVFTKNRQRLLDGEVATAFLEQVVEQARGRGLLSGEHFTVDGTLLEAWAGLKSFKRKGEAPRPPDDPGNPTVNFHGETRSNDTHASTTDPEARLARKGPTREAKLAYAGHVVIDNGHGLVVNAAATAATGWAERPTGMPDSCRQNARLGTDSSESDHQTLHNPGPAHTSQGEAGVRGLVSRSRRQTDRGATLRGPL
jgi:transposase